MQQNQKRIVSLDYLRGIGAFTVLINHMYLFNYGEVDASTFLGRTRVYAVSIFHILSGLTLYKVYIKKLEFTTTSLADFYHKRIVRIFPLLWVVIAFAIFLNLHHGLPSVYKVFLNLTGLFGILKPSAYLATGTWSIGNELSFYLMFPMMIYLFRKGTGVYVTMLAGAAALFAYFTFSILSPSGKLAKEWSDYINPLDQFFLFAVGSLLGRINNNMSNVLKIGLFLITILIFLFYPAQGDPIHLVTGWTRIALTADVILLVYSFYQINFDFLASWTTSLLKFLDEISYSLYLLHPVVFYLLLAVNKRLHLLSVPQLIAVTIITSLGVSYLSYTYYEKWFMKIKRPSFRKNKGNSQQEVWQPGS